MSDQGSDLERLLKARSEIDEELRRHKGQLTVLFTDIVGSTSYFDRYGDTAGVGMLHRHSDLAARAVAEFRGRIIKTIGDSVMAEFPEPVLAVRAAVEMQRRLYQLNQSFPEHERIQLRIGINSGTGFRDGNDLFGDAVNVAARITKHAVPAQILVSLSVRNAIAGEADLRTNPHGKVTLAGKAEKEDTFEVVWTDTATYGGLRQTLVEASARGELISPSKPLEAFVQPAAQPMAVPQTPPQGALPAPLTQRYDILAELGRGGMGIVCKARDRETGEFVALKVLKADIADDAVFMERFKRELRLARRITHKNVCRVHEFNRAGETAYISMEYVDGESLRAVLKRFGSLPLRKGMEIGGQICAGLGEAHSQGVVHRDLKPENVMIDREGHVKIMDFGIAYSSDARLTTAGTAIGTPGYMAPEQVQGKPLDPRADLYALGCILFEMFTGAPVFAGDTPISVALKHLQEAPRSPRELEPGLPPYVEQAILKCLEKDPASRFASVAELEAALAGKPSEVSAAGGQTPTGWRAPLQPPSGAGQTALVASPTMTARAPSPALTAPQPRKSHMALAGGLAAAGVLAAGLAIFWVHRAAKAPETSQPPPQSRARQPEPRASSPETESPPPKHAAPGVRPGGKAVQLMCLFHLREAKLTIASGREVLLQEALQGEKRGGFLRFRGGFFGSLSRSLTVPAGARELSVRVVGPQGVDLSGKIPATPPAGVPPTLQIVVGPERLQLEWGAKPRPR